LDANQIEPKEIVSASKKLGREDASAMAKAASKLVVSKGKKLSEFKTAGAVSKEAVDAMLGPTGNLRAPTMRVGKTILVGFNEEAFEKFLI
jgi:arsenate reductase-like glutaredoxin family protein